MLSGTVCLTGWWAGSNHVLHSATHPKTVPAATGLRSSLLLLPARALFPVSCLSPTVYNQASDVGVTQYVGVSKTQRVQCKATKLLSLLSLPGSVPTTSQRFWDSSFLARGHLCQIVLSPGLHGILLGALDWPLVPSKYTRGLQAAFALSFFLQATRASWFYSLHTLGA